jgi:hypothetical protein
MTFNPSFEVSVNAQETGREIGNNVLWQLLSNNTLKFQAKGLPFHSYGNGIASIQPKEQNYFSIFKYNGGTNTPGKQDSIKSGIVGFWLNGVAVYSSNAGDLTPNGFIKILGYNYNAAYASTKSLGYNFLEDLAGGHTSSTLEDKTISNYHYHDYSFARAWTTGVAHTAGSRFANGIAEISVIPYLNGGLVHEDGHSKILGYSLDGYPIYGPYGYTDPTDPLGGVSIMSSGYQLKNQGYRSVDANNLKKYPMGIFVQDYMYNSGSDLDQHNGRYCCTPEYPDGTYAYFCSVDENLNPVYPYVIGDSFYGTRPGTDIILPPSTGTYPIWITEEGDLGKISSQKYYDLALEAVEPTGQGKIEFSLIAGELPKGLRIQPTGYISGNPELAYVLEGVPFNTNKDVTSTFTIRATSTIDYSITDRTFFITVTGNYPPEILTVSDPLGVYLDGTEINLQLEAIDLNQDNLTWSLLTGELPLGTTFNSNGLLSGIIQPEIYEFSVDKVGWDFSLWNNISWEFSTRGSSRTYNFTVAVTDSKVTTLKKYRIVVFAYNDVRADSLNLTTDLETLTCDLVPVRPPILVTKDLDKFQTVNSGGYFAFKFDGINYDQIPVYYSANVSNSSTWDSTGGFWDQNLFDKQSFSIPEGLTLDPITGWLTGFIKPQVETTRDYNFGVNVYSKDGYTTPLIFDNYKTTFDVYSQRLYTDSEEDGIKWINNKSSPTNTNRTNFITSQDVYSPLRIFTLTVLGNIDLNVQWITDTDLGSIIVGSVSNLAVEAQAVNKRPLTYSLKNGSKLPQGLALLQDGTVSGRVSFQSMGFDRGQTSFDKTLAAKFVYNQNTNFDNVFTFTVIANDYYNQLSAEKTFTVRTIPVTYEPYENLYIRCMPSVEKRIILEQIINNTDVFDPEDIYRPKDPYFGLASEIKFLVSYGIKASKLSDYIAAMQNRHFNKKFYFGDYKVATAKDSLGNSLYDVLYVDLIEDTKVYSESNGLVKKLIPAEFTNINLTKAKWRNPRAKTLPENQIYSDNTPTVDKTYLISSDNFYEFERLNVISPNDLTLMQRDINLNLQNSYLNSLPEWMVTVQDDGKILGYTSGAVLAYLKPGTGAKALYKIKNVPTLDINVVPFVSDRYVLNNSYTANFNLDTRRFISHRYTTFDNSSKGGLTIEPVFKVDFAVDRPFSSINGKTLNYVISTGGLDGITYNLQSKYIIFATQEKFNTTVWGNLSDDGWNYGGLSALGSVLGYKAKTINPTTTNRRGGVWQIHVDIDDVITLNFIREITPGEYIYVQDGNTHMNSLQLYDLGALSQGFTVPKYKQSYNRVYKARSITTFDKLSTEFINNVDTYTVPLQNDKYLKYPKIGVFTNGQ